MALTILIKYAVLEVYLFICYLYFSARSCKSSPDLGTAIVFCSSIIYINELTFFILSFFVVVFISWS